MESHKVALKYPCQSYEDESIEDASFFTYFGNRFTVCVGTYM